MQDLGSVAMEVIFSNAMFVTVQARWDAQFVRVGTAPRFVLDITIVLVMGRIHAVE